MATSEMARLPNISRGEVSHRDNSTNEIEQYRGLMSEIQDIRAEHQDVLTQYKINVAVLENELGHVRHETESGMTSLRLVIEALTRNPPSSITPGLPFTAAPVPQISPSRVDSLPGKEKKQYEAEIERLRRENRSLKQKVNELERRAIFNEKSEEHVDKEKGKENVDGIPFKVEFRGLRNVPTGPRHNVPRDDPLTGSMLVGSWGQEQSPGDEIPTEPNSPVFAVSNLPNFDIGLNSLEDNLKDGGAPEFDFIQALADNGGFPDAIVAPLVPSADSMEGTKSKEYPLLEKGIDEQLADEDVASRSFKGPPPSVLRTGFQVGGNKRGEEYDPTTVVEVPRTYSRSRCLWLDPNSSSNSRESLAVGPGTAFNMPTDRSFDPNLWQSIEEREVAIKLNAIFARKGGKEERAFPDFFRYGIQYIPGDTDSNFARTLHISNLPEGTDLREVLARVRGGEILSATLLQTTKLTGGLTVRVVFMHEGPAEDYVSYAAEHPILFGEDKKEAVVTLINTPTYPLNLSRIASFRNRGHTRCIAIPNFPVEASLRELERSLACGNNHRADGLVELWIDEGGTLHLQFSSINLAGSAYGLLGGGRFNGLCPAFEPDPCAGPVEELEQDLPPRPPMLPRNRKTDLADQSSDASTEGTESSLARQVEVMQRKRLAALSTQKVEIPSFSDARLKSRAWADMVDDDDDTEEDSDLSPKEEEHSATNPTDDDHEQSDAVADTLEERVNILTMENINQKMADENVRSWEGQKRPIGLAGSKYASLLPDFEDRGERPRVGRGRGSLRRAINHHRTTSDLGPLAFKTNERDTTSVGLGIRLTEEAARKQEAESEYAFNTLTRHGSYENFAVQPSTVVPHRIFKSADHSKDKDDKQRSHSPHQVELRELLASSSESSNSSKSRSPSPYLPDELPPFDMSLLDIYKSSNPDGNSSPDDSTAKPSGSNSTESEGRRDSNSTDPFGNVENEQRRGSQASVDPDRYAVHDSPRNPVRQDIRVPRGPIRQDTAFVVPPIDEIHSDILNRRRSLSAIRISDFGAKRKRTSEVNFEGEEMTLAVGEQRNNLIVRGDDLDGTNEGAEVKPAIVNPDEISLEEDEDE